MELEWQETLNSGKPVHVRPIVPTDLEQERAFVEHLSRASRRFRFLADGVHPSNKELLRLCDVDRDHNMAFVATISDGDTETMVGGSRYAADEALSEEVEIADDEHMAQLARDFGFETKRDPDDARLVIYSLALTTSSLAPA